MMFFAGKSLQTHSIAFKKNSKTIWGLIKTRWRIIKTQEDQKISETNTPVSCPLISQPLFSF